MNYSRSSHSSWRPFWGLVLGVARGYYKEEVDNVKLPYVVVPLKQRFKGVGNVSLRDGNSLLEV